MKDQDKSDAGGLDVTGLNDRVRSPRGIFDVSSEIFWEGGVQVIQTTIYRAGAVVSVRVSPVVKKDYLRRQLVVEHAKAVIDCAAQAFSAQGRR